MGGRVQKPEQSAHAIRNQALEPYARPEATSGLMRVSIVVLNYNYARFVAQAIESALAQDHPDTEIVVVDNGSTDVSPQVIAAYAKRVRIVRQPVNIGQGQGYNLGFEAATGEWIVWLDADDLLDADAISSCLALAQNDTAKVQFPLRLIDSEARPLVGMVPYLRHQGDVVPLIRRFGHYGGPPAVATCTAARRLRRTSRSRRPTGRSAPIRFPSSRPRSMARCSIAAGRWVHTACIASCQAPSPAIAATSAPASATRSG